MMRLIGHFFKKPRPVYQHIVTASIIVAYWWALWNILDVLFLPHSMTAIEIVSIIVVALISLFLLFVFHFDF